MKSIVIGIVLALASSSAMAWKNHRLPVHKAPQQTQTYNHVKWGGHKGHSYNNPPAHSYDTSTMSVFTSPLRPQMSMETMPHAGIQICSTPIAYSDDRRCNGFRVGEHCLVPVYRAELDLMPPPPPAVEPDPVPVAPVKPENG